MYLFYASNKITFRYDRNEGQSKLHNPKIEYPQLADDPNFPH